MIARISRRALLKRLSTMAPLAAASGRVLADFPPGLSPPPDDRPTKRRFPIFDGKYGCYISERASREAESDSSVVVLPTSGYQNLDVLIPQEAKIASNAFGVAPGFLFLNDRENSNAFATPASYVQGTSGTVLYGVRLIHEEVASALMSGNALVGILAHEHAHILQFQRGIRTPGARMELHADFMSGWYLAWKQAMGVPGTEVRVLAQSLFSKGDMDFNSPQHHGTPEERVNAMANGYNCFLGGARFASQAFDLGARLFGLV